MMEMNLPLKEARSLARMRVWAGKKNRPIISRKKMKASRKMTSKRMTERTRIMCLSMIKMRCRRSLLLPKSKRTAV